MKNITDPALRYLHKLISANLYWYGKTAFTHDSVRESVTARIIAAVNTKYKLVERAEGDDDSE